MGNGNGAAGIARVARNQEPVKLLRAPPQELEQHHQQHNADARHRKRPRRANMPGLGDEARVDCVPVPEHLSGQHAWFGIALDDRLTEILQPLPIPSIEDMLMPVAEALAAVPVVVGVMLISMPE